MSFTGQITQKCPGCSEEGDYEVWSFVRGDQDETLRDRLKGGELNVLECANCGRLFVPEISWVYADPSIDLIAFVFPELFAPDAAKWREKMREDFARMRPVIDKLGLKDEPLIFFGAEPLAALIEESEVLSDESAVADWFAAKLELARRLVEPAFARRRRLPRSLPFSKKGYSREGAVEALRKLVKANDRLAGYRRWLEYFEGGGADPPFSSPPP
ncbi:MAG: hypothetical protein HY553_04965 [Elusimicrobia bacterium]|nr:hypothetical protein [Elusimicrobiota bacterium]